jgi:hypothetical protein
MSDSLKHPTHLAIAALGNSHTIPAIGSLSPAIFDGSKLCESIIQSDSVKEHLFFFLSQRPQNSDSVLSLKTKPRVHQIVGQFTRAGEQQQPLGIQIESTNALPLSILQLRQAPKYSGSILGVIVGNHLSNRFVVRNHSGGGRIYSNPDGLAIDLDAVTELNALTDMRGLIIDRYTAFQYELLHFQP